MSQVHSLVETLTLQGIELWAEGEQLRYRGAKVALTPEWLGKLKEHKSELLLSLADNIHQPTQAQIDMWAAYQGAQGKAGQYTYFVGQLEGELNEVAFQRAWQTLVQRHMALRTTYGAETNGSEMSSAVPATIHGRQVVTINRVDAQRWHREELESQLTAHQTRAFNLAQGPLLRITLFARSPEEHLLLVAAPRITLDDSSLAKLLDEFGQLYTAACQDQDLTLPALTITPATYAAKQRGLSQHIATATNGTSKPLNSRIADVDEEMVVDLPLDYPRNTAQGSLAYKTLSLPDALIHRCASLVSQTDTSLDALFLAALQLLLHRYTGQERLPIGIVQSPQRQADFSDLVGSFTETAYLKTEITASSDPTNDSTHGVTFMDVLGQSHQQLQSIESVMHSLVHPSAPQVVLAMTGASLHAMRNNTKQWGSLKVTPAEQGVAESTPASVELKIEVVQTNEEIDLTFGYRTDLFLPQTINRLMGHFHTLLTEAVTNPKKHIATLELLTDDEYHQLAVEWARTERDYPSDKGVHQLFEAQVERTPDAVAVVFDGDEKRNLPPQSLTYHELNVRANQLAHYLQSIGVGCVSSQTEPGISPTGSSKTDSLVGLCVERTLDMVVGVLGILKAGGAYVPLDPNYPADRVAFMLQDASVSVLLTQEHLQGSLPPVSDKTKVVYLDRDRSQFAEADKHNPDVQTDPSRLAYVLYTSGSTGRPKGVMVEHQSPTALIAWAQGIYNPTELSGVLASTSICFDLSVYELFLPLSVGGKVILAENALHLPHLRHKEQVTLINTVPSSIEELFRQQAIPVSVQIINLAGEPLRQSLVDKLYTVPTVHKVYDLYGPSEDTTYSTFTLRRQGGIANIGKPIDNTQAYILDSHLQLVPVGIAGELHLGGDGLARGYLNRPELTAEKFITNPFGPADNPGRLYKTGDLVRWLPSTEDAFADGPAIEYLGRIDHQVKIRGFRIELGEIEAVLGQHPDVQEVVLVARAETAGTEETSQKQLVAYIAGDKEAATLSPSALRDYLGQKLPYYMIPSLFTLLDALPRTPNGKVNRKALPAPEIVDVAPMSASAAPENPVEAVIVQIWCDLLNRKEVGIHDRFMELGGHSLQAMQVIAKLSSIFQVQFPLSRIIEAPTVAALAQLVEEYENKPGQANKLARLQQRLTRLG